MIKTAMGVTTAVNVTGSEASIAVKVPVGEDGRIAHLVLHVDKGQPLDYGMCTQIFMSKADYDSGGNSLPEWVKAVAHYPAGRVGLIG